MQLGVFSISLNVKDIKASREFYGKLGFKEFGGDIAQNWLIMKNGEQVIGLFQGMIEKNTLTFNPGWDSNAQLVPGFTDVRQLQRQLEENGIQLAARADESTTGPAYIITVDPDGNPILIDQHI
ncbi:VOC family protein [Pseudoduganella eburnea]|uniref:VOC family protein n=1 Tax=Massilia eburnea TaxID=1776165 RepID=A0A6L6QM67_9BURK|nr:VOC family protein [Massilia eburnea]MTW13255.1 VOC family protein [Massilia eburnea]